MDMNEAFENWVQRVHFTPNVLQAKNNGTYTEQVFKYGYGYGYKAGQNQLEKAMCCGSCRWYVEQSNTYVCFNKGSITKKPWSCCKHWGVRE